MTPPISVIPLEQATPGMVLAADVCIGGGNVLLPSNTMLTESHLASLQQRNVMEVCVAMADAPSARLPRSAAEQEALRESTQLEVQHMFRRTGNDPTNLALCKTVLEYRLEKIG